MRFAYADPPYPGQAARHYADHPDYGGEVDHAALIARLVDGYPDGWALSTSSPALRLLLPLCPPDVRVLAWVKPFCAWKGVRVAYSWEPVLFRGGRRREAARVRDWVSASMTTRRGVAGAKPEPFCAWVFRCLGAQPGDMLDDLYPGSGAVGRAWRRYLAQLPLRMEREPSKQLALAERESALW